MEIYYLDSKSKIEFREGCASIITELQPITDELIKQMQSQLNEINEMQKQYQPTGFDEKQETSREITPVKIPHELTIMSWLREERNKLLAESDWTQMPDVPLDERTRQAWREYRQQLRDLPETISKLPDDIYKKEEVAEKIEFPRKPERMAKDDSNNDAKG